MREVLIRSPSIAFAFGISASQLGAVPGGPFTIRALSNGGTCTITMQASPGGPATDVDCAHLIAMPRPATRTAHIAPILRLVAGEAGRTRLARVGGVYLLHPHAQSLGFVGNERAQLVDGPGGNHAVVFAGFSVLSPTACACRALVRPLANASEVFQADDSHTLRLSMRDDLPGEFMVDVAHPAAFFALALAHRPNLARPLQLLATGREAAAHHPLIARLDSACPSPPCLPHG